MSWTFKYTSKRQDEVWALTCPLIKRKQDGRHVVATVIIKVVAFVVISAFRTIPFISAAIIKVNIRHLYSGL